MIVRNHSAERVADNDGVGAVVVSMSAQDIHNLADLTADDPFPTNTHAMFTPAGILRIGAVRHDFPILHDPDSSNPLHIGRTGHGSAGHPLGLHEPGLHPAVLQLRHPPHSTAAV